MLTLENILPDAILHSIYTMLTRAKTAPKAKGVDHLIYKVAQKEEIKQLSKEITRLGIEKDVPFFIRDARNIENLDYILLIGAKDLSRGVPQCGFCGYENCGHKLKNTGRCAYDLIDLGIALGSAMSAIQHHGIDSRIMFTVGKAAVALGMMEDAQVVMGIPLSVTEKSIFFDRMTT